MTTKRPTYTPEEDMALWRFAMEDHPGYGTHTMWKLFAETGGTWRHLTSLSSRFYEVLVLRLPEIPFHTETKLDICARLKIPVEAEFLKVLEKDADIGMDDARLVKSFTMKPTVGPNLDKQLSDEELLKITTSIAKKGKSQFSREEDAEMWKFAAENHDQYYGNSTAFWEMMVRKLNWERTAKSVTGRFKAIRSQLHNTDFEPETKLILFKKFKIPVNLNFLELLKSLYEVKIDDENCIYWYQKKVAHNQSPDQADKVDQAEKRKCPSEDTDDVIKKSRLSEDVVEDPAPPVLSLQETIVSAISSDGVAQKDSSQGPPQLKMEPLDDDDDVFSQDSLEDVTLQNSTILESVSEQEPEESPVLEKEHLPANESMSEMTQVMQEIMDTAADQMRREMTKMMEKVSEKIVHFDQKMTKMSKTQEESNGSVKKEVSEVMQNVTENKVHFEQNITKMLKTLEESMKKEISEVAKTVAVLADDVKANRQQIQVESAEKKVPNRKEYLQKLKNFVSSINAPDMEDVLQKIDTAIQNSPDDDLDPIPARVIRGSLDMTLLLIGQ